MRGLDLSPCSSLCVSLPFCCIRYRQLTLPQGVLLYRLVSVVVRTLGRRWPSATLGIAVLPLPLRHGGIVALMGLGLAVGGGTTPQALLHWLFTPFVARIDDRWRAVEGRGPAAPKAADGRMSTWLLLVLGVRQLPVVGLLACCLIANHGLFRRCARR